MIFVDTNYFLRFLLKDISLQHIQAKELFIKASEGKVKLFTSTIVIFEIYWVFTSFYGKAKKEVVKILSDVLSMKFIEISDRGTIEDALVLFKDSNLEFEDCFNIAFARRHKMSDFATFDRKVKNVLKSK